MMHGSVAGPARFTPDQKQIVSVSHDGTLKVWNAGPHNTEPVNTVNAPDQGGIAGFGILPDQEMVTIGWTAGGLAIWNMKTAQPQEPEYSWDSGHGITNSLAVSPDGRQMITVGRNQTVKIWNMQTRSGVSLVERASNAIFSPSGTRFATASDDGTARIWDAETHQLLLELPGHSGLVLGLDFDAEEKRLVSGGEDLTVQVYTLETNKLLYIARERLVGELSDAECRKYLRTRTCPDVRKAVWEALALGH
jgi:WD40 repeat protein